MRIEIVQAIMTDQCELYDRECIDCGECDLCDLDSTKRCDDCGMCIDEVDEYRSVTIQDFMKEHITKDQVKKLSKKLEEKDNSQKK
ncbi:hypothetical protein Cpap_3221 [Ruminiclostridium papyrosolvens DSM 2782]|uniref:Uncharacterized protein n=1 Tax=Ruminiclostridium papyrosolvens DSM 2782 TaxID=588581 RepID=F1TA55_9FIRM|nr:hypothetical protein [Ruminiclostridium papyrosolvens]EGD48797.1 hypothetical protein Cpap_3221 [Ruminiclostridium papyrosolvens DSM 2782]WES32449.1 hypothetical protein P0092_11795 [Ruminiclostridium papyrosolvens DSM 2782]